MITTYKSLLLKKAQYLLGRDLTADEGKYLTKTVRVGNHTEIKMALAQFKVANSFSSISEIVNALQSKHDLTKASKQELVSLLEEVVVKTTSVQAGLRILRKAGVMSQETLLKYIYNLYLCDATMKEKRIKKGNRGAITNDQAHRPEVVQDISQRNFSFENVDKNENLLDVYDYDSKDQYLANEFRQTPDHNGPKSPDGKSKLVNKLTITDKLKSYFRNQTGKPTGAPTDQGNQK